MGSERRLVSLEDRKRRMNIEDQENMDRKRRLVAETSPSQPTGETQQFFPASFTNPNPCILEDAQRLRVPEKQKQESKGKSPYPSRFSGAHNGATVLVDRQRDATRNLQICNMGATPEQNPGFAMLDKRVSKTISRPVKLFGVTLTDTRVSQTISRPVKLFGVTLTDTRVSQTISRPVKLFGVTLTHTSTGEQDKTSCGSSQETREDQYIGHQRNPTRSRAKVYRQGNRIGRSVDLRKFEGYPELISELEVLFNLEGQLGDSSNWEISYRDDRGDTILVGDEPWQEFCKLERKIDIYKCEKVGK